MGYDAAKELQAEVAGRPARWTGGRIASLAIGILLVLVALALLGAGGTGLWADQTQREAGYVTTGEHRFSTTGSALATESTHLGATGVEWLYSPGLLGKVRIRVTPTDSGRPLFVGIARVGDVDSYLAGVSRTVISDFWGDKSRVVGGGRPQSPPGAQHFWVASAAGPGSQTLVWKPSAGAWSVVVMNADGRPGLNVGADLGARFQAVIWIAVGLLIGGALLMAGGVLLILGAIRNREGRSDAERQPSGV